MCAEHVLQEEELAVADAGQCRRRSGRRRLVRLRLDGVCVALPVLAVGGIGDLVVEALPAWRSFGERAAEEDVLGVAPVGGLHEEVGLADREGLGVHLLAEEVDVGVGVDAGALGGSPRMCSLAMLSMPPEPQQGSQTVRTTPLLGIRSSSPASSRSTIRWTTSRGVKCSPGFSFEGLVELADELLEDRAHRGVVDLVGVEVDVR